MELDVGVVVHDARTVIVTVTGELDLASVGELAAAVGPALDRKPERLVVDVGGLRFADSSAIALWVRWSGSVREFELRDATPLLRTVIARMGLAETLTCTP